MASHVTELPEQPANVLRTVTVALSHAVSHLASAPDTRHLKKSNDSHPLLQSARWSSGTQYFRAAPPIVWQSYWLGQSAGCSQGREQKPEPPRLELKTHVSVPLVQTASALHLKPNVPGSGDAVPEEPLLPELEPPSPPLVPLVPLVPLLPAGGEEAEEQPAARTNKKRRVKDVRMVCGLV